MPDEEPEVDQVVADLEMNWFNESLKLCRLADEIPTQDTSTKPTNHHTSAKTIIEYVGQLMIYVPATSFLI